MRLENKVAIVTGAASGIGLATAKTLAREGAYVFLADINDENGEKVAEEIRGSGQQAEFIHLDVTDSNSINAFKDKQNSWLLSPVDVYVFDFSKTVDLQNVFNSLMPFLKVTFHRCCFSS